MHKAAAIKPLTPLHLRAGCAELAQPLPLLGLLFGLLILLVLLLALLELALNAPLVLRGACNTSGTMWTNKRSDTRGDTSHNPLDIL